MWAFPMNMEKTGASGSLVKAPGIPSGGNSTLVYFSCADCATEAGRVAEAGGRVEKEKFSIGEHGFVALALDYYVETGGAAVGSDEKLQKWPQWKETVRNAVQYLQGLPSVSGQSVGLVGYSRGAFLAVSVASSVSGVKAVVDLYGGGGGGTDSLEQEVRNFPALLILHGEADDIVPVRFAHNLRDAVIAHGGEVEMHLYAVAGHAFNATFAPTYSELAASDAFRRTVEFLRRRLAN